MEFIDYYKILELDKSADINAIKKAYRKLARKLHPDLNPNDSQAKAKFQQINEANEVLSDPEKRKKYDKYGKDWKHADEFEKGGYQRSPYENNSGGRQERKNNTGGFGGFEGGDFSDFFGSMFGGQGGGQRSGKVKYRGEDFNAELKLDLKDVFTTHQQTLSVNNKSIRLTIPAGVENGQTIKIPGHGNVGANAGPNGDLYITFLISNHTKFKREGNDLFSTVEMDLFTAVLGGDITIDTFDGKVKLSIKAETQNGAKVKLKGKGFPVYKKEGIYGDLYITWQIKTPVNLSEKEKELFIELSKLNKDGK